MKKKTITKSRKKVKGPLWRRIPLVGVIRDISNYRNWIKTIQEEAEDPHSKFNRYGLDFNFFYVLYIPVSLPQEDAVLPENIKRLRLMEVLTPIHQYLDNDLGFAGSIVPEFNQFYDEEGNPTLTYGIIYRFAFDTLSLKWVVTRTLFTSFLIFALVKWPIINWVVEGIKGLF
jgi:hypothetical protein